VRLYCYEKKLKCCEVRKVVVVVVVVVILSASLKKGLGSPFCSPVTSYLDMAMLILLPHLHLV